MRIISGRQMRVAAIGLAAGSLVLTGCTSGSDSKSEGESKGFDDAAVQAEPVTYGNKDASQGPAAKVEGARKGGTIKVFQETDFSHLDPGQIYVSDAKQLSSLIFRGLTDFKEDGKGGIEVVGDIATNSGEKSDGGKTWKYTLKDGIKDEHGHEITSKDVRHSIERLYADFISDGPLYIQQWLSGLDYRDALEGGPYDGNHLPDSVLETPDDKTVIFHFKEPQPDLPQALSMPGYSIVPEQDDTKEKYDHKPTALGPYKISKFKPGKGLTLVRNQEWDPETDSVRHQYAEAWDFDYNHDPADQTERLLGDQGGAKNATQFYGQVPGSKMKMAVKEASDRSVQGYQPYVWQLNFNMDRVKDKRIRDAITYAIPNGQLLRPVGGDYAGAPAGGLVAPTVPGFEEDYDPYGKVEHPNGQPEKGKKLVEEAGAKGKKLVFAYSDAPRRQKQAVIITKALEKIGFDVQKKQIDQATWYEQVGKVKNSYDLYMTGWGQDWPSLNTIIPPVYDGDQIADGASNYSHIDDEHVNKEIDRILKISDKDKARKEWVDLHHYIVEEVNPAAPLYFTKTFQIYGSNIGGARYSLDQSYVDATRLYLKK